MSDSLQPHGLQHTRPPCPSPAPGVYSNSCPLSVTPSNRLILCHLLFLSPSIFPSIRVFSSQSVLHIRWPKYWSFSFSIHPSYEYSGLISFRMDWLDLLAVQGTLKSLLQHHSSKASILQVLSFLYGPTLISIHDYWKNHSLDKMDLCWQSNVSLLFNMLYRLVIAFLPRSKNFLISCLQSLSAVTLEPPKIKSLTVSIDFPSFNFMAAITICSDFGAQKIVCHCFHCFSIYLP